MIRSRLFYAKLNNSYFESRSNKTNQTFTLKIDEITMILIIY
jgi:hypothetical protein